MDSSIWYEVLELAETLAARELMQELLDNFLDTRTTVIEFVNQLYEIVETNEGDDGNEDVSNAAHELIGIVELLEKKGQ